MARYRVEDAAPTIPESCFVAPNASLIGDVKLGAECSVWPFASIRADSDTITIGKRSNVQDNAVLHTADGFPTRVRENVTIGHQAVVHGCTVEDTCLIGMGARVLSDAHIGAESIVAAGAVVTEGMDVPPRSMVMGVPGEVVRELSGEEVDRIRENAAIYVEKRERYKEDMEKT